MIDVLIADDHPIVRHGLKDLLETAGDIRVVGQATSGWQLLDMVSTVQANVLVLDLIMPGPDPAELIRQVCAAQPSLAILVLSMQTQPQTVTRMLRAGAMGFIAKDGDARHVEPAIRRIAAGEPFLDPDIAQRIVLGGSLGRASAVEPTLSEREEQVLMALARGVPAKRLAYELGISPKTVSAHKARLLRKLRLATTTDLLRYALERQIV